MMLVQTQVKNNRPRLVINPFQARTFSTSKSDIWFGLNLDSLYWILFFLGTTTSPCFSMPGTHSLSTPLPPGVNVIELFFFVTDNEVK